MACWRVLVVDDEPLARKRICSLLETQPDIQLVGQCCNGREAVVAIENESPDIVFLDIQMPELDGFDVVQALSPGNRTAIIFVTAFNEHAVRAFEVNALDYLLKPYDSERFTRALDRARQRLAEGPDANGELEQRMVTAIQAARDPGHADRLMIRDGDRLFLLDVREIDWIEAEGKFVRIHAGQNEHVMRETMQSLESRLDPRQFARIHRSTIVNLDSVKSLEPLFHGEYSVLLQGGERLTLSRGYRTKLRERFGNQI